jgi:hypothetical protein
MIEDDKVRPFEDEGRSRMIEFSPSGTQLWSHRYGNDVYSESAYGLAIDSQRNITLGGMFSGQIDFGQTPIVAVDFGDSFLAKFAGVTQ